LATPEAEWKKGLRNNAQRGGLLRRHGDTETRKHGEGETRKHGKGEAWKHGEGATRKHGKGETRKEDFRLQIADLIRHRA
jgi:hypothetical protein